MVGRSHVAGKGGVGPREIVVVVGSSWAVSSPAVVKAAEDVETLAVDIEVEDHHNEEVHQAEQQHSLADPLQGPAQHQPAHGQSHAARSATRIRSTSPLLSAGPSCAAVYQNHLWIQVKQEENEITLLSRLRFWVRWIKATPNTEFATDWSIVKLKWIIMFRCSLLRKTITV